MDPDWSAFAHYNRSYCTIQIKGDGYIRRAIDDLKATLRKLGTYKKMCLFSEIYSNASAGYMTENNDVEYTLKVRDETAKQYYIMINCQSHRHTNYQNYRATYKNRPHD